MHRLHQPRRFLHVADLKNFERRFTFDHPLNWDLLRLEISFWAIKSRLRRVLWVEPCDKSLSSFLVKTFVMQIWKSRIYSRNSWTKLSRIEPHWNKFVFSARASCNWRNSPKKKFMIRKVGKLSFCYSQCLFNSVANGIINLTEINKANKFHYIIRVQFFSWFLTAHRTINRQTNDRWVSHSEASRVKFFS